MRVQVEADFTGATEGLQAAAAAVKDATVPLGWWATYKGTKVEQSFQRMTFEALDGGPRDFDGVLWPQVPPFYTRKTGPEQDRRVPQFGGVKRIAGEVLWFSSDISTGKKAFRHDDRVKGNVKGRLRPSGKRVRRTSIVGMDTNAMVRQFTRHPVFSADRKVVTLTTNKPYAPRFNDRYPFAFVTQEDGLKLNGFCLTWLARQLARFR